MEPAKKLAAWKNKKKYWRATNASVTSSPLMSSQASMKKASGKDAIMSNMTPNVLFIGISKLDG